MRRRLNECERLGMMVKKKKETVVIYCVSLEGAAAIKRLGLPAVEVRVKVFTREESFFRTLRHNVANR